MNDYKDLTWDDLKAMFAETGRQIKESDQEIKKIRQIQEETARQMKETDRQMKETALLFKKTDRQRKEADRRRKEADQEIKAIRQIQEEIAREMKETDRQIKAVNKQIGGMANSNGDVAEAYFINSFKKYPHFAGQDFQFVDFNLKRYVKALDLKDEYDIVLYNGVAVAIIETKYKVRKEDVEQIVKKAETFKILFPLYKDYALYLGLAGFHVFANAEKEANKQGVGIIKQVGKSMLINDAHLKAF